MDDQYDVIVLGTGLKECILSGLLSIDGKKVLHVDRNKYYGGAIASITPLENLFEMFKRPFPTNLGRGRDWNIDLIPKLLMADGKLAKLLLYTEVTNYVEFKVIAGSFVYNKGFFNNIYKIPCNEKEVMSTNLLGLFEKRRFLKFLVWATKFDINDKETYTNVLSIPQKESIRKVYDYFDLDLATQEFIGHAICLYLNNHYIVNCSALEVIDRVKLYGNSLARFGSSPYLYPMYGLGELPQGFARLSAVHGGTYILQTAFEEILYDPEGQVTGVKMDDQVINCNMVICDPTYAPNLCVKRGKIVRAICILNHPIPHTGDVLSCQIIIPQSQVNRKHDIYVCCVSYSAHVASKYFFLAQVATEVETIDPKEELKAGIDLLGSIEHIFYSVSDMLVPADDGIESQVFITESYDATTHFESTCADLLKIYNNATGEEFDFTQVEVNVTLES